jgi:putative tryptophan/tyrosine transport system substrate-binding protein
VKMNLRLVSLLIVSLSLMLFAEVAAAQPRKTVKIGWLGARSGPTAGSGHELFRREFVKLGYVEGKDVVFEARYAHDNADRLPALADELLRQKVDVLLAAATAEALAAKQATKTIPIVFFAANDPVATGLVDSLARPGGNLTGFTNLSSDLTGKRMELLAEMIPGLSRVAVLWDPKNRGSTQQWKEHQTVGPQLGLQFQSLEVSRGEQIASAFIEAVKARSGALSATSDPLFASNVQNIAELARKHRLPSSYPNTLYVDVGGLMSYGQDRAEPYKRAAIYVDRILKGAKPADLPVEQPTKFELVINLKTAKQIGLTIPQSVLYRADRVIK